MEVRIDTNRKIIHIDMDAFFASVEQLDNPELKGKPIAVGGNELEGVVAAASYEARKFGVKSAMSSALAARLCKELIFVRPRFERYKEISTQIQTIFHEYTDLVEPLSLDEAFLDVTNNKKGFLSATLLAQEIRARIAQEIGLTASAGISINKFVAKIASDVNKPNGQLTIPPAEVQSFLEKMPVDRFFGIGKVTAKKLNELGIRYGIELKQKSLEFLVQHFGNQGPHYFNIVRGIHNSPVKPHRTRKSFGIENTYSKGLNRFESILEALQELEEELIQKMKKRELLGKCLTLKIRYTDFETHTKSKTSPHFLKDQKEIHKMVVHMLQEIQLEKPVRLLGLSFSKLNNEPREENDIQLTLEF